ncbi:Methyltransferase-like protein 23 [Nymphaea thermarum]|nr:Methyltransferase-like protein 23 [Nymphaea thermarum]
MRRYIILAKPGPPRPGSAWPVMGRAGPDLWWTYSGPARPGPARPGPTVSGPGRPGPARYPPLLDVVLAAPFDGRDGFSAVVQMRKLSEHKFGEDDQSDQFSITIIEVMQEDYGMFVWPCSIILAEYVWQQRARFSGATVVEVTTLALLGAGTSLPGLAAAKLGSEVILTDNAEEEQVLENMQAICSLNGLSCKANFFLNLGHLTNYSHDYFLRFCLLKVVGLTWGEWDAQLFDLRPQIILGADVLYESNAFDDLFATVAFLLHKSPGSVFITTYDNRSGHHLIEYLMVKWGLKCVKILDAYSFMPASKSSSIHGNIELVEIKTEGTVS